jgi:hypothetical protein
LAGIPGALGAGAAAGAFGAGAAGALGAGAATGALGAGALGAGAAGGFGAAGGVGAAPPGFGGVGGVGGVGGFGGCGVSSLIPVDWLGVKNFLWKTCARSTDPHTLLSTVFPLLSPLRVACHHISLTVLHGFTELGHRAPANSPSLA